MAVKVQNTKNIRKAKRWNEKDDAALLELLRKKTKEVNLAIKEAQSPFMRARLKAKRAHYRSMANKVANGTYNGDIIFSEMQAAAALRTQEALKRDRFSNPSEARKYINSYEDMDFDYEAYFRKTRYYGVFLPILLTLLTIIFLAFFALPAFMPSSLRDTMNDYKMKPQALFTFKLGSDEQDFSINNDGNWPDGDWRMVNDEEQRLAQGEQYIDPATGEAPEQVLLYAQAGMRTINISAFDIVKAWFSTKMLSRVRLDFLEDNKLFMGPRWLHAKYIGKAEDNIVNLRKEDGSFDVVILIKYLASYGIILFFIAAFLIAIVCLIQDIIRIFTYTTRRMHTLHWLLFIFSLLVVVLPAFLVIEGTNEIGPAFRNYFIFDYDTFMERPSTLCISVFAFLPAALSFIMLILPKLFKNRLKKLPTFVPKGNRPRRQQEKTLNYLAYDNVRRAYQNNLKR
jgi:hypothetical protein